jgi:hypothetical protein
VSVVSVVEFALFTVALCVPVGVAAGVAFGPVSRRAVERFARRQRLQIPADNGDQIIRYLATTRRWRSAGVAAAWVLAIATTSFYPLGTQGNLGLFAGWLAGALIAEVRVAHLGHGVRRAASLQRRRPTRYLSRPAWALVPAAAALAMAVAAASAVAAALGRATPDRWVAVWTVVALATAAAIRLVQRIVVRRAQPLVAADALAADEAIRSRSLHVLSGAGAALVLLCVLAQLGAAHPLDTTVVEQWRWAGLALILLLGWNVATAPWPRQARPGPTGRPVADPPGSR